MLYMEIEDVFYNVEISLVLNKGELWGNCQLSIILDPCVGKIKMESFSTWPQQKLEQNIFYSS